MRGGVITERNADFCTVRVRVPAGNLTIEQMRGLATIAKKYGAPFLHITTRQAIELPHMDPRKLPRIAMDLHKNGTPLGSERDEIVNVVACPGVERCKYANIDTISLAKRVDAKLFGREMPVKIRISISGCPNGCTSPLLNEIGVMGRIEPLRVPGMCTGCGTCVEYCKEGAVTIRNGVSVLDESRCAKCGMCILACPFGLLKSKHRHYHITVGGRRGRHPKVGRELLDVENEETVAAVVEEIVRWVYRRAWSGRLLSDQMDELQFEAFKREITEKFGVRTES